MPQPVTEAALKALALSSLATTAARVAETLEWRERLANGLRRLPQVLRVYPSAGNFLLVRFIDADAAFGQLLEAGVVVRDMRAMPQLGDALRISIGTPDECRRVLEALDADAVGVAA
jgi:histidinol-phosphate aminotransferase